MSRESDTRNFPETACSATIDIEMDVGLENNMDPSLLSSEHIASLVAESGDKYNEATRDEVDVHIAQALNRLSMKERDQVFHDLHGVNDVIPETPDFVATKVQELQSNLMFLKDRHPKAKAFHMALEQQSSFVFDTIFQLMFLRAESFHVAKAADRMIRFFDLKLFLFGPDALCHDITMDNLSKEDANSLKAGFLQLLPFRDRAGRAVIIFLPAFQTYAAAENMSRILFYMFMCALEDEETQRRGMACIIYGVGESVISRTDLKTVVQGAWIQSVVPVKTCSLHHCISDTNIRRFINVSMKFFGEETKARAKMHHGTHVECVYALMTYGIPPDSLPVTMDGDLKRKNHLEWIKMRKRQETQPRSHRILIPSRCDVLFGRGKPFREHIGNLRLFNLLDDNLERYEKLRLKEKSTLIAEMVDTIRAEGGRFLIKQDGGLWTEVDDKQAREKVSHAFRTRMRIVHVTENIGSDSNTSPTTSPLVRPDEHPSADDSSMNSEFYQSKRARTSISNYVSTNLNYYG